MTRNEMLEFITTNIEEEYDLGIDNLNDLSDDELEEIINSWADFCDGFEYDEDDMFND